MDPRNWLAPASALALIYNILEGTSEDDTFLRQSRKWTIVPLANPDGYVYNMEQDRFWRKNRQTYDECFGTDLLRNWDKFYGAQASRAEPCHYHHRGSKAFSEIETIALRDAILAREKDIELYLSLQSNLGAIRIPWSGRYYRKTEDHEDLLDITAAAASRLYKDDNMLIKYGTPTDMEMAVCGVSMDWVKATTKIKYTYALDHLPSPVSGIPFLHHPGSIHGNAQLTHVVLAEFTRAIDDYKRTGEWRFVTLGGKMKDTENNHPPPSVLTIKYEL